MSRSCLFGEMLPKKVEDAESMHIDGYALALLLGIGILSYLLGYLCSQMQFPEKLPQKEIRRRSK